MIYITLMIIAILMNAIMDVNSLNAFDKWAKNRMDKNPSKFNKLMWEWINSESWNNKYEVREWLISKGFPTGISNWLAKDVIVIFLDLWHFAKAIMMVCFEIPIAVLVSPLIPFIPVWGIAATLFFAGGILFNIIYYRLRKI